MEIWRRPFSKPRYFPSRRSNWFRQMLAWTHRRRSGPDWHLSQSMIYIYLATSWRYPGDRLSPPRGDSTDTARPPWSSAKPVDRKSTVWKVSMSPGQNKVTHSSKRWVIVFPTNRMIHQLWRVQSQFFLWHWFGASAAEHARLLFVHRPNGEHINFSPGASR